MSGFPASDLRHSLSIQGSQTTIGAVLPWWIFRATFLIVLIALIRRSTLGNPHLALMKHKIIVLSDVTFVVSTTILWRVCPEYHVTPLYASSLPEHWRLQLHYARSDNRPYSRLSFKQFSFHPHIQFFILLCLVNRMKFAVTHSPTCYTPCQVSHFR